MSQMSWKDSTTIRFAIKTIVVAVLTAIVNLALLPGGFHIDQQWPLVLLAALAAYEGLDRASKPDVKTGIAILDRKNPPDAGGTP